MIIMQNENPMFFFFSYPLPKNPHTEAWLSDIRPVAEKLYGEPIKALPYTAFRLFHETGSRSEYETEYMQHRKMLCAFGAMVLSAEDNERWVPKLCDLLWAICDEYTWALPAHIAHHETPERTVTVIDLFASETGMALAELVSVVSPVLPEDVAARVRYEIERRIVAPYLAGRPRFGKSNWSAVCACGVGAAMIRMGYDDAFETVKTSLYANLQDFLDSYLEDGCCMEGSLYWAYGFGFFCYFAELLYEYTDGTVDYFADEKVKKIAFFGPNSYLSGNRVISFSDSPHTLKFDSGLWSLLARKYPGFPVPDERYANRFGDDLRYRFASFIRSLYWGGALYARSEEKRGGEMIYYDRAAWYIVKGAGKSGFAFAAKAGCNSEPHNHNDVGSFLLLDGDDFILDDVGWASYTKEYFNPAKRYGEIFCTASFGHSVPIVDGMPQKFGREFTGRVLRADKDGFALEFAGVYGLPSLERLERVFALKENGLVIRDAAKGTFGRFTERFVTRVRPVIDGETGTVRIGAYTFTCDKPARITISDIQFEPRFVNIGGKQAVETAYRIDFEFGAFSEAEFCLLRE